MSLIHSSDYSRRAFLALAGAGLEDTFELADGSTAKNNAEIVAEAAHMIVNILGAS